MAVSLDKIVPLGRSLDEYRKLFSLEDSDLDKRIIGVGDGPASFNAEMNALGRRVVSVDPIYTFSAGEIEQQFYAVIDDIIDQVRSTPDDWSWSYHNSPENLRSNRTIALEKFISDYEPGKSEGRYVSGELPRLDFPGDSFELALCSHLLFLYSAHLSGEFHEQSILELMRLAPEVRIFPLLNLSRERSPYVDRIIEKVESLGHRARIVPVDYEMQKGGKEMLQIKR